MRGLLLLANGFEDTEALTTRDVLLRAGMEIYTASINDEQIVTSSFGIEMLSNVLLKTIKDFSGFDFLVLPGGGLGTKNLKQSLLVKSCIKDFFDNNKLICAICAAPSILGELGYLKNTKYTCFAGFNEGIDGIFTGNEVEIDKNIITGRSMNYSVPFALAIITKLMGVETTNRVEIALKGLNKK